MRAVLAPGHLLLAGLAVVLACAPSSNLSAPPPEPAAVNTDRAALLLDASERYGVAFGANELRPVTPRALDLAHAANIQWVRLGLYWQAIEPRPGELHWQRYDDLIATARAQRFQVLALLAYATPWATTAPPGAPGNVTHYPPSDQAAWLRYVTAVVSRYHQDVHAWEVWNEPDFDTFWGGTPAEYASLLAVTYQAIKAVDPAATVVLGGLGFRDLPGRPAEAFLSQILFDPDHPAAYSFDVASFHHYGSLDDARRRVAALQAALAQAGVPRRPIWITETGQASNPSLTYSAEFAGPAGQAEWLRQTLPSLVALGVARVFWFQLFDVPGDDRGLGLLDATLNPRPAYSALRGLLAGNAES